MKQRELLQPRLEVFLCMCARGRVRPSERLIKVILLLVSLLVPLSCRLSFSGLSIHLCWCLSASGSQFVFLSLSLSTHPRPSQHQVHVKFTYLNTLPGTRPFLSAFLFLILPSLPPEVTTTPELDSLQR